MQRLVESVARHRIELSNNMHTFEDNHFSYFTDDYFLKTGMSPQKRKFRKFSRAFFSNPSFLKTGYLHSYIPLTYTRTRAKLNVRK